jgi:hypothetical protein
MHEAISHTPDVAAKQISGVSEVTQHIEGKTAANILWAEI